MFDESVYGDAASLSLAIDGLRIAHDDVSREQERSIIANFVENLKNEIRKCKTVNREAEHANVEACRPSVADAKNVWADAMTQGKRTPSSKE
ncbi:hypothetical protein Tco_1410792 [Tanacetum coccineum]